MRHMTKAEFAEYCDHVYGEMRGEEAAENFVYIEEINKDVARSERESACLQIGGYCGGTCSEYHCYADPNNWL